MVAQGDQAQGSRKRRWQQDPPDNEQGKASRRRTSPSCYPPQFWDTLSTVRLTRRALEELDRRQSKNTYVQDGISASDTKTPRRTCVLRSNARLLKEIASRGGPDLSRLRSLSELPTTKEKMSESSVRKRKQNQVPSEGKSSASRKTRTTTPYSAEFEQKMIDRGIYPDAYLGLNGETPHEPNNIGEIQDMLTNPRPSLSPSTFSGATFQDFRNKNRLAGSEAKAMVNIIPIIAGSEDTQHPSSGNVVFNRLKEFDPDISSANPDTYYGANPAQINSRVRENLCEYIVPSGRRTLPAAPNYFLEGKSASGRPDVANRRAMYAGAVGARGMLHLQNYGKPSTVWDGNAYTLSSTFHPGTGTLQIFATHPVQGSGRDAESEYYMTQVDSYAMTGNSRTFRQGATAYRNARDWTKQQRDRFIADANIMAESMSVDIPSNSNTQGADSSITAFEGPTGSKTSEDELALGNDRMTKRRRDRDLDK